MNPQDFSINSLLKSTIKYALFRIKYRQFIKWRLPRNENSRRYIEGFAVETVEKLIFAVKGLVHPPDRLIAYVRYLPDSAGNRIREGVNYRRVYHFNEQHQIIQTQYPAYLHDEPAFGISHAKPYRLSASDRSMILVIE